jgi:hypothetical protein
MPPTLQFVSSSLTLNLEESKTAEVNNGFGNGQTLDSCAFLPSELSHCGLTQYFEVLVRNGFDAWTTVLDIREEDLEAMHFKLGHRRKLQRHIFNHYFQPAPAQSLTLSFDNNHANAKSMNKARPLGRVAKRSYNRRLKPDMNAVTKPKLGYVLYSNHMRENPEVAIKPFDAIAKHIGHIKKESASPNMVRHSFLTACLWFTTLIDN